MSYTIVADVCEGIHDCVPCCPVECIHHGEGTNGKGTTFTVIDPAVCTNCGVCLSICPIEGAILDQWRPELQAPRAGSAAPPPTITATVAPATAATATITAAAPEARGPASAAEALAEAKALEEDGDTAGAMAAYERVFGFAEAQFLAEAAFRLGSLLEDRDPGAAVAAYRKGLAVTDSPYMPRCALDAGVLLHRDGSLAAAAELYRQAMNSPLSGNLAAIAACNLGMALESQGDVSGAVWAFRGAVGCADPRQSPKAAHRLAKLLEKRGDTSGAVTAFEQVFRFDDDDLSAEAAFDLGYMRNHNGDTRAAIEAYRRGLEFTESEYLPMCAFNAGLLLMGDGNASGAAEMYRRALESPHTTYAALAARNLGEVLTEQGELAGAVAAYRRAIDCRQPKDSPKAALALAKLLEGQGDTSGAAAAYQQVLELDDDDLANEARNRLAQLQSVRSQDPQTAVRDAIRRWAAGNLTDASEQMLTSLVGAIETLQSECCDVKLKFGAGETKSRHAVIGFSWLDAFHTFDLSDDQARRLGIAADDSTLQGVGGNPRADTREFPPAMQITGLRINDGRPVRPDAPFTVTVSCDPGAAVPQNVALRVSYPLDGMTMGFSQLDGGIPSDGLLRKEVGPLAEDHWDGAPVPMFVDVVAIHQDRDELRFTIFSNTLSALVDVEPASAPQADDAREVALRWIGSMFTDGPGSPLVVNLGNGIDGIVSEGNHFAVLMPADFTTDNTAYYAFSCAGGFFPLPMTPEQAAAAGVKPDGAVLRATFNVDAHASPHIAELRDLQMTADGAPAADAGVHGTVVGAFHKPPPENLMLRVSRIFDNGSQVYLQPVRELPAGGVMTFTLRPNSEEKSRGRGPVAVAVDLCVTYDSGPSVDCSAVSNSVVSLFDVIAAAPTPQPPVLDATQEAIVRRAFEGAGIAFPGQSSRADTEFRGTLPAGYLDCFLADGDVAGMTLAEDNRVLRTFDGDAFPAAGGLVCGLTRWQQTAGRSRWGRRASRGFPSDRVIDLRWMFSDADSALRWHRDRLEQDSEGMPPLGSHSFAGVDYHCFGGEQNDSTSGGTFVSFNILFVVGPVVAKLFAADTLEELGLTAEQAQELAHKAAQRIATAVTSR
jgi:tetratricopeptide (TPR) repeat protein/NAD-dependent dihydropyrimidine dehydrogenase PreA subunit